MTAYRHILAAIDLDESAEEVMIRAGALAAELKAQISALHVASRLLGRHSRAAHVTSLVELEVEGMTGAQAERLLGLMDRFGARHLLASGRPWRAICRTAEQLGADLVVMGSRSSLGIPGLAGSTAGRVAHSLACDALVVRHGRTFGADGELLPYRRVLGAVDLSRSCAAVADHARDWAERQGAELIVVHVEEYFPADRSNELISPEDQDPEDDLRRRSGGTVGQLIRENCAREMDPKIIISDRSVKQEILGFAREREVDLIVVGSHGVQGPSDLLGSTADGMLHRAHSDVLLVRVVK